MAMSSAATTICISQTRNLTGFNSLPTDKFTTFSSLFIRLPVKQRSRFSLRSSTDVPQETTTEVESESSVEASNVPYSLISALNVEKALRGIAITDANHYGRLGIQIGCPYDQVPAAYKLRCEELINQGLDEDVLSKKLELLKESYYILSSEEERRLYDWSLARSGTSGKYVWPFEVDITQTSTEDPPPGRF
ncbi:NAD(P)H-quinone oxidoreductase subunit U protein [Thalictrum thalictroides]|uniref:NAD(P)H-quinone oxidoreductase subunit U protein n=1 Tax=Thalictrum thalictroides TaxID=46969 RepID=A0A7J6VL26_THATH|nr:NAD(P)H-quinone oxidoreductase subunit U protein [Thalictrum thalictroides]